LALWFGRNCHTSDVYEAINSLDYLVVMDLFMTPTAEMADIVLPAASWLEIDQLLGVPYAAGNIILAQQK
jgi:anaerobic selenocysteine-containing dehydrogenase